MPKQRKLSDCTETLRHSRIRVDDKRSPRWAVFLNPTRSRIRKIRVDGCLVRGGPAADWIVSKADCVDVVVELKGRDVDHALEQAVATLRLWNDLPGNENNDRLAVLIVCTQYPRETTKIDRARKQLAQDYRAPLHIRTRNLEYEFDTLAKFET